MALQSVSFDAWLEKDHAPQLADDIAFVLELIHRCRRKIHRLAPRGDGREQIPIGLWDRNHMVEAWVFAVGKLGEPIVGTLARMRRNDVVDHDRVVRGSGAAHRNEVILRPECWIDLEAHAVEVAVDRRRVVAAANAARAFHRPGMHAQDANRRQGRPQMRVAQRLQDRLALPRDNRGGVGGEPHRGQRGCRARSRFGIGLLPHAPLTTVTHRELLGIVEHGMLDKPAYIIVIGLCHLIRLVSEY